MGHLGTIGGHLLRTPNAPRHLAKCGPCVLVDTVTLDTSQYCLTAFTGTYALSTSSLPGAGTCGYDLGCYSYAISYSPSVQPDAACDTDLHYLADRILIWAFGLEGGYLGIRIQCIWRVGFTEYALNGKFESVNYGLSFGAFVIDEWPAGCATPPASTGPANGSDLTCSVTLV